MRFIAACIVLIVGCKSSKPKSEAKPEPTPAADAASVAVVDAAPPIDAAAGPTVEGLASDIAAIEFPGYMEAEQGIPLLAKLLPGFEVTHEHHSREDLEVTEYFAAKDGKQVVRLVVSHMGRKPEPHHLSVQGAAIPSASGLAVGATVGDVAAKHADLTCKFEKYAPEDDYFAVEARLYCESKSLANVTFELDPKSYQGKPQTLAIDQLATKPITSIDWKY